RYGRFERTFLLFSIPLMGQAIANLVVSKAHTLVLGIFYSEAAVGVYSTVVQMAGYLSMITMAFGFIYVPVLSSLVALRDRFAIARGYRVMTKWLFAAVGPLMVMLFFFPSQIINLLFGSEYVTGAAALRILALVGIPYGMFGPALYTLISLGRTRDIFWTAMAFAGVNLILCFTLIPPYGMVGAAAAFFLSAIFYRGLMVLLLRNTAGPFCAKNLKIMGFTLASTSFILAYPALNASSFAWWWPFLAIATTYAMLAVSLYIFKGVEREDMALAEQVSVKTGIPLSGLLKILAR
ncbi:MAG TPA: hypothetical protein ENN76_02900, partial [Euryarchaeota archaeon]|nr:hypothetical protein [Euryarchaeota archaeon]